MPDLAGRVSLIVWRDPEADPPPFTSRVLVVAANGSIVDAQFRDGEFVTDARGLPIVLRGVQAWAELPAPSEATTDDVLNAIDALADDAAEAEPHVAKGLQPEAVTVRLDSIARLRALLPGGE